MKMNKELMNAKETKHIYLRTNRQNRQQENNPKMEMNKITTKDMNGKDNTANKLNKNIYKTSNQTIM